MLDIASSYTDSPPLESTETSDAMLLRLPTSIDLPLPVLWRLLIAISRSSAGRATNGGQTTTASASITLLRFHQPSGSPGKTHGLEFAS